MIRRLSNWLDDCIDKFIDIGMPFIFVGGMLLIVGIVIFFVVVAYISAQSPSFELRKDQWSCTATVVVPTTIYVESGKVLMPVTTTHNECTNWKRNY